MRRAIFFLAVMALPLLAPAKMARETLYTSQGDRIVLTYDISVDGEDVTIRVDNKPQVFPGDNLRKECDGKLDRLKVVLFERVGTFGKYRWSGMSPRAFLKPSGSYNWTGNGFFILGESSPISFTKKGPEKVDVSFPLYVAVYQKKYTYKIIRATTKPWKVACGKPPRAAAPASAPHATGRTIETERVEIMSTKELEADNEDLLRALNSVNMVRQLLASETEVPFSQTLQMEIYNLRALKDRVTDQDVIAKINEVLLMCSQKERELKDAQNDASLSAQAQEQALAAQQKAEEEAKQKEADEKARQQEEKQQKRTLWMIIGGVVLAVLGFVGNGIFKHFRDVRNQKSIMEMQESIARQAQHEAGRRSREIVRNKAHQVANRGKSRMRQAINASADTTSKSKKNTKIKSI